MLPSFRRKSVAAPDDCFMPGRASTPAIGPWQQYAVEPRLSARRPVSAALPPHAGHTLNGFSGRTRDRRRKNFGTAPMALRHRKLSQGSPRYPRNLWMNERGRSCTVPAQEGDQLDGGLLRSGLRVQQFQRIENGVPAGLPLNHHSANAARFLCVECTCSNSAPRFGDPFGSRSTRAA